MFCLDIHYSQQVFSTKADNKNQFLEYLHRIEKENYDTLPSQITQINVVFVDDSEIQKLNNAYRKKNYPTDVLSFFLYDDNSPEEIPLFGEIYISVETAQKQALERNHALQAELNILFVHGVLHLLGFDHLTEQDFVQMQQAEKKILKENKTLLSSSI